MRARHGTGHRPLRPLPASHRLVEAEAATSIVTEPARVAGVVGLVGEHPEPELSFGARLDAQDTVVIAMELRTPREDPRRQGPCTERIEQTEYIERMCARNSS